MTDYIDKAVAMRKLVDLPAELDAVAVQRCIEAIHSVPAADVVEVVRCKDCGFWYVPKLEKGEKLGACGWWSGNAYIRATRAEDYCSRGVRKEG